jgi:hypothetical protein
MLKTMGIDDVAALAAIDATLLPGAAMYNVNNCVISKSYAGLAVAVGAS